MNKNIEAVIEKVKKLLALSGSGRSEMRMLA